MAHAISALHSLRHKFFTPPFDNVAYIHPTTESLYKNFSHKVTYNVANIYFNHRLYCYFFPTTIVHNNILNKFSLTIIFLK